MDELSEFLDELRMNWRNPYWWADHQALQVALLTFIAGSITLAFKWAELTMEARMKGAG